jgi:protein-histidine N-methyltransferase
MAFASPVGKKMYEKGLRNSLISPKHSFLATYVMQEKRKESTTWDPYLDILPKNFTNFPIFYTDDEKKWLEGSVFLN